MASLATYLVMACVYLIGAGLLIAEVIGKVLPHG